MSAQPIGETIGALLDCHGVRGERQGSRILQRGDHAVREPSNGYGRDLLDIEGYARGLARRRPISTSPSPVTRRSWGPRIQTRMGAYLSAPIVPSVIGYQPRLQFLHEEDALGALEHHAVRAVGHLQHRRRRCDHADQAIRRAGRIELPVPSGLVTPITGVFADVRSARLRSSQMDYLTYGRVLDNTRMRTRLGFEPRFTTSETLEDFHRARRLRHGRQSESLARVGATHRVHRTPVAIATGVTLCVLRGAWDVTLTTVVGIAGIWRGEPVKVGASVSALSVLIQPMHRWG